MNHHQLVGCVLVQPVGLLEQLRHGQQGLQLTGDGVLILQFIPVHRQLVAAAQNAAAFQVVGYGEALQAGHLIVVAYVLLVDFRPDVVGLLLQLFALVHNALVQRQHGLDDLAVLTGHSGPVGVALIGVGIGQLDLHRGHLALPGYPALHAQPVHLHGPGQHRHHRQEDQAALPPVEHPKGLLQHHFRHKVAHSPAHQHHQQQGEKVVGDVVLQEDIVQKFAQPQSGKQGHAPAEHRPQPGHGDHIPRPLQLAAAVEGQGQADENQPHNDIDQDIAQADEPGGEDLPRVAVLGGHI